MGEQAPHAASIGCLQFEKAGDADTDDCSGQAESNRVSTRILNSVQSGAAEGARTLDPTHSTDQGRNDRQHRNCRSVCWFMPYLASRHRHARVCDLKQLEVQDEMPLDHGLVRGWGALI